jgi:hypothetical protein
MLVRCERPGRALAISAPLPRLIIGSIRILLPGEKVNVNAVVRVTQLEQNGFTLIYE